MKSFDVVHIHPSACRQTPRFLFVPAGIVSLINELRAGGFDVISINEPMEMLLDSGTSIEDWLPDYKAPLYAIDIHWHEHIYSGLYIAQLIKRIHPESHIVVGGATASCFADDLLRLCPSIDCVVAGYGEGQLLRMARMATNHDWRPATRCVIRAHVPPDLDQYDNVTFDWMLNWRDYIRCAIDDWMVGATGFWLKNGMGCSLDCAFCGGSRTAQQSIFGNNRVVHRSAPLVASDIVALSSLGIQRVALTQDPNLAPNNYWSQLHSEVRKHKVRPAVYVEAVTLPSDAFLADFAATYDTDKSIITIWPVCASESTRFWYGKHFSNREVFCCLRTMKRYGIHGQLYLTRELEPATLRSRIVHTRFVQSAVEAYGSLDVFESFVIVDPASPVSLRPQQYGLEVSLQTCDDYLARTQKRSLQQPYDHLGYILAKK